MNTITATAALRIGQSNINGAGMGLFTDEKILKGKKVVKYMGELFNNINQCDFQSAYCFAPNSSNIIDASMDTKKIENSGRFINTARNSNYKNNTKWGKKIYFCSENNAYYVWIYASRNIKSGEELFIPYGRSYTIFRN